MNLTIDFSTIIQVYQLEGLVALGKMANPATQETAVNKEHAKYVIDVLDVLAAKTKGNLTDDEAKMLDQTIGLLKLNFVDVS